MTSTVFYVLLAVFGVAIVVWLVCRFVMRAMRRYVRNLWPHS